MYYSAKFMIIVSTTISLFKSHRNSSYHQLLVLV